MDKLRLFQIVFIVSILVCIAQCRIAVKVTNLKCASLNEETARIEKCTLKAVKRDIVEISVYINNVLKSINASSLQLSLNRRGDHKSRALYRYKVDCCEFMTRTRRNPIAEIFFKVFEFLKYSNMNHSCPYNHDLIIDRCRLDTKPLNFLSIAQGEYTIYTTWSFHMKPALQIDLSIRIS